MLSVKLIFNCDFFGPVAGLLKVPVINFKLMRVEQAGVRVEVRNLRTCLQLVEIV